MDKGMEGHWLNPKDCVKRERERNVKQKQKHA